MQGNTKSQPHTVGLKHSAPIEEGEEETFEVFLSYSDHFEERVQVQDLLSKLEEEERQVLRHLFWNGYSVGETARLMGFSVKKVRTILQKSLSKLKYYLSPQEGSFRASQMEVSSLV
ncbi:MAG: sigma-70 family RNA polymerase sigma factor [Aquificaceae bacterium]|nr:sigma-70 family RNA polymerase sigma factor [Aquificaceae bacterium]